MQLRLPALLVSNTLLLAAGLMRIPALPDRGLMHLLLGRLLVLGVGVAWDIRRRALFMCHQQSQLQRQQGMKMGGGQDTAAHGAGPDRWPVKEGRAHPGVGGLRSRGVTGGLGMDNMDPVCQHVT
jgi:hypothetical protein